MTLFLAFANSSAFNGVLKILTEILTPSHLAWNFIAKMCNSTWFDNLKFLKICSRTAKTLTTTVVSLEVYGLHFIDQWLCCGVFLGFCRKIFNAGFILSLFSLCMCINVYEVLFGLTNIAFFTNDKW